MSIKKIKTGVLSYGMSGRIFHTPFLEASEKFDLHAVVERSNKLAKEKYADIVSYDSVDELLNDEDIELVVVNTPNHTHYEFTKRALLAGKHVLVEKPFTPTKKEARKLFDLARNQSRFVLPYHNRRFDSDFLELKEVLESNKVGDVVELHLRFDRFRPEIGPKQFKETKVPGSGILYDLGSHLLDQAISLFGRPKAVTKVLSKHRKDTKVDDYAFLLLNYDSGFQVHITVSLFVLEAQPSIVLHGTKGTFIKKRTDPQEKQLSEGIDPLHVKYGVEEEGNRGQLSIINDNGYRETIYTDPIKGDYMQLFESVYDTIRKGKEYFVAEGDILCQLEIMENSKRKRIKLK